jgi:uncharacterized repeat protein (TIGR02543 family)
VEPLFSTPADPTQVTLPSVNPSVVLRQRLVYVGFHLLADGDQTIIHLNPFDDVGLTAVQERRERNAAGGYAWYGRVEEVPSAEVVLVVEGFKLAASITQGDRKYTVRHVRDDLHLVREMDLTAMPRTSGAPRTLTSVLQATPSAFETDILTLVNQERSAQHLHSLSWDTELHDAARGHSVDMAANNYFSHTSQDGRTFSDRIQAAGYQYNTAGENIAAGYSTPEAAMNGWMNSSGHRANILNSSYCDLGVGYAYDSGSTYDHYWTQDFGRKTGVLSCPSSGNGEYNLTIQVTGQGTVAMNPTGGSYSAGTAVTLTATADSGWQFSGWSGDLTGSVNPAAVTMDANKSVTATFTEARDNDPPEGSGSGGGGGGGCFIDSAAHEWRVVP